MRTVTIRRGLELEVPNLDVIVCMPSGALRQVRLSMRPLTVGSQSDCDLVIEASGVSRRHCTLALGESGVELLDLESKNGCFVQGVRCKSAFLEIDQVARIGDCTLRLAEAGRPTVVPLSQRTSFGEAFGASVAMRALFHQLEIAARTDETVLLTGESGTGKEVLARAIHDESPRSQGPFVVIDCGAISPDVVEAELFGHARGAFTGAVGERVGLFEQAHRGTVFLDEIGELPPTMQPKLLRALESKTVRRVGDPTWRVFDARIIAATHRDLRTLMRSGEFREDLFYRLAVVEARVPPLRERKEDVELLVERMLAEQRPPRSISALPQQTVAMLLSHGWPGNVRELRNTVARLVVFPELGRQAFDPVSSAVPSSSATPFEDLLGLPLRTAREALVDAFERTYVNARLDASGGNITSAAEASGVSRQFFHRLVDRHRPR